MVIDQVKLVMYRIKGLSVTILNVVFIQVIKSVKHKFSAKNLAYLQ